MVSFTTMAKEYSARHFLRGSVIIFVLMILLGLESLYLVTRLQTPGVTFSSFTYLNPLLAVKHQEDFIVNFQPLRESLDEVVTTWADKQVVIGVQFEYLNTGTHVSFNQNYRVFPASLTKVPVVMLILRKVEDGKISLQDELTLTKEAVDSKWGELYLSPIGTKFTIEKLILESLVHSDNTAHKILYRSLSEEDAEKMSEDLDLVSLFDQEGNTTAREYARVIRSLYNASYLSPENSKYILELLTKPQEIEFIRYGIPDNVAFAHKFGEDKTKNVYLDAGIVYLPERPYILTIMIDAKNNENFSPESASELMKEISEQVYQYIATN